MSNLRNEWNALGKLIGLALQVAGLIALIYVAVIACTALVGA